MRRNRATAILQVPASVFPSCPGGCRFTCWWTLSGVRPLAASRVTRSALDRAHRHVMIGRQEQEGDPSRPAPWWWRPCTGRTRLKRRCCAWCGCGRCTAGVRVPLSTCGRDQPPGAGAVHRWSGGNKTHQITRSPGSTPASSPAGTSSSASTGAGDVHRGHCSWFEVARVKGVDGEHAAVDEPCDVDRNLHAGYPHLLLLPASEHEQHARSLRHVSPPAEAGALGLLGLRNLDLEFGVSDFQRMGYRCTCG